MEVKATEERLQGILKATGASRTPLRVKNSSNRPWAALLSHKPSMRMRSNQATGSSAKLIRALIPRPTGKEKLIELLAAKFVLDGYRLEFLVRIRKPGNS